MCLAAAGCLAEPSDAYDPNAIPLGLLLSYTGNTAANSINSERAVRLAVERINHAGGLGGRPLRLVVRDIQSDGARTERQYADLVKAGIAAFIGPDSTTVLTQFVQGHRQSTLFLPSVAMSAHDSFFGANNWFTFAPHTWALACAFQRRLPADGVTHPVILYGPDAFHSELAYALRLTLDAPDRAISIPSRDGLTRAQLDQVLSRAPDAILVMGFPESAAPAVSDLSFHVKPGTRWYLSPTLHTPHFFEVIPPGALLGAQLPRPGRATEGAAAFEAEFLRRWDDEPLDEAYAYYDAAAIAALALQAALTKTGALPTPDSLGAFVRAVAGPPGTPVTWDALDRGLALVRAGEEIDYQGVSGQLDFDDRGNPAKTLVQWWRVDPQGGADEGPPQVTDAAWGICR